MTVVYSLSAFQRNLVLSVCPPGARVVGAEFVREWLHPCPVRVRVILPHGGESTLILRLDRAIHGVERETKLLPLLGQLGLPVPTVLAGPVRDPTQPQLGAMSVLTLLPGEDLITWGYRASLQERKALEPYVLAAIVQLQQLATSLSQYAVAAELPHRTLQEEFQSVADRDSPWYDGPAFAEAVERLIPLVERVQTPLVFSNGDYNPANFLFDGQKLTGFVDFAWACFEDPLFGIARYMTYDWLPYDAVALTGRYAATHNFSTSDLDLRVAVACLWRLQELPYADEAIQDTSAFVLRVLRDVLDRLNG